MEKDILLLEAKSNGSTQSAAVSAKRTRAMRQNDIPKLVVPVIALPLAAVMISSAAGADIAQMGIMRIVAMLISAALYIFSFSSLIGGVWTVGMLPPICIGAFGFLCTAKWDSIVEPSSNTLRVIYCAVAILAVFASVVTAYISALMLRASHNAAGDGERLTVVVLGCKTRGDRPSLMLEGRLRAAAAYLERNPETVCIVSGGQGSDEEYTEAHIMSRFLRDLGIAENRILVEDRSVSTRENLAFSLDIIKRRGLPKNIAIATDRFHQFRASLIAVNLGLHSCAINRDTRWYLVMQYWFREVAGIIELRVRGR